LNPDTRITQETVEGVFADIFGERETHLRIFFLNQRRENKLYTFWVIQAFLEIGRENEDNDVWIPLKTIRKILVPEFIKNKTSLHRLLDKMATSHIVDRKSDVVTYGKTAPGKTKEDAFYRLSGVSFVGYMNKNQKVEADRMLSESLNRLWGRGSQLQKELEAAKRILQDLGVSDPDLKINEYLQTQKGD
jgi:hypothetical protein